jgi:hypothetical protein
MLDGRIVNAESTYMKAAGGSNNIERGNEHVGVAFRIMIDRR